MARQTQSPFYQPRSPLSGIADGLNDLFGAYVKGQGTAAKRGAYEASARHRDALTRETNQDISDKRRAAGAARSLASVFEGAFDSTPVVASGDGENPWAPGKVPVVAPGGQDAHVRRFIPRMVQAVGDAGKFDQVGNMIRALVANAPGTTDNAVLRSVAGAGGTIGADNAFSIAGQGQVSARNAGEEFRLKTELRRMMEVAAGQRNDADITSAEAIAAEERERKRKQAVLDAIARITRQNIVSDASRDVAANKPVSTAAGGLTRVGRGHPLWTEENQGVLPGVATKATEMAALVRELKGLDRVTAVLGQAGHGPNIGQAKAVAFGDMTPEDQARAVGPTKSQVEAEALANMTPEEQEARLRSGELKIVVNPVTNNLEYKYAKPGDIAPLKGATTMKDAVPAAVRTAQASQSRSLDQFRATSTVLRDIASKDPSLFGITGNVRRLAQGLREQLEAASGVRGVPFEDAVQRAAKDERLNIGTRKSAFDPNLPDIVKFTKLAAYQAAGALADQTGRGLSDNDFRAFEKILGDPTAWLANQKSFLAGLDRMDAEVERRASKLGETPPKGDAKPQLSEMSDEELNAALNAQVK